MGCCCCKDGDNGPSLEPNRNEVAYPQKYCSHCGGSIKFGGANLSNRNYTKFGG